MAHQIRNRVDKAGLDGLRRRAFLLGSLSAVSAAAFPAAASANSLRLEMILRDPAAPVSGNPAGKLTMVTFLDYNCPWCKKTAIPMRDAVLKDGDIRVVYKDWPIITKDSVEGARLALAANYQGGYEIVHHALMAIKARRAEADEMRAAVRATAIDFARLESDLKSRAAEINALIERNHEQAMSLQLTGTPAFIIGKFLVPGAIRSAEEFTSLFEKAREQV
ncbi:DsbA family protein [Rhizobium sp.]|uniref:DsbA family protein n=1 Tax=Rhizobium sp. TaxID=391 RepID=UPI0026A3B0CD